MMDFVMRMHWHLVTGMHSQMRSDFDLQMEIEIYLLMHSEKLMQTH